MFGNRRGAAAYIPTRDEPVTVRGFEHARGAPASLKFALYSGYHTLPKRQDDGKTGSECSSVRQVNTVADPALPGPCQSRRCLLRKSSSRLTGWQRAPRFGRRRILNANRPFCGRNCLFECEPTNRSATDLSRCSPAPVTLGSEKRSEKYSQLLKIIRSFVNTGADSPGVSFRMACA